MTNSPAPIDWEKIRRGLAEDSARNVEDMRLYEMQLADAEARLAERDTAHEVLRELVAETDETLTRVAEQLRLLAVHLRAGSRL